MGQKDPVPETSELETLAKAFTAIGVPHEISYDGLNATLRTGHIEFEFFNEIFCRVTAIFPLRHHMLRAP